MSGHNWVPVLLNAFVITNRVSSWVVGQLGSDRPQTQINRIFEKQCWKRVRGIPTGDTVKCQPPALQITGGVLTRYEIFNYT